MVTTMEGTSNAAPTQYGDAKNTNVHNSDTKDPFIDQTTNLSQNTRQELREVENVTEEAPHGVFEHLIGDGNDQTIRKVLESWTYITNAMWDVTQVPPPAIATPLTDPTQKNMQIISANLPEAFTNDPLIKSKINFFKYMRCDFVAQLKVNASPQQQGMLFLFYDPEMGAEFSRFNQRAVRSIAQITTYKGVFLNLEETDTAELEIPFMYYKEFFQLTNNEHIGAVRAVVMAPLRGASDSEQVETVLNVRAKNIDLRIPTVDEVGSIIIEGETQCGERCDYDHRYKHNYPVVLNDMATQGDISKVKFTEERQVRDKSTYYHVEASSVKDGKTYKGHGSHFILASAKFDACMFLYCLMFSLKAPVLEGETQIDDTKQDGFLTRIANKVAGVSDAVSSVPIPIVKTVASGVSWGARLFGKISSALGFSKPDTTEAVRLISRYAPFGAQHIDGVTPGINLGAIQDNSIEHSQIEEDEMDFAFLCSKPVVIDSHEFTIPGANSKGIVWRTFNVHPIPDKIVYNLDATHNTVYGGPMQVLTTLFGYWRGPLVYHFRLIKTKFVKGRLQISYIPTDVEPTVAPNINRVYSKIWDVGVDTEFEFEVPWPQPYGYQSTTPDGHIGYLQISVFNRFNYPDNVSDTIQLVTSLSAPKIEFALPTMAARAAQAYDLYPDTPSGEIEGECQYEEKFTTKTATTTCVGEKISNLRQLLKKVGWMDPAHTKQYTGNLTATILQMYALYRGSFRYLLTNYAADQRKIIPVANAELTDIDFNDEYPFFLSNEQETFITCPYYSRYPAMPTYFQPTHPTPVALGTVTYDTYIGIGDDFSAWGLIAPSIMVHAIHGPTKPTSS
nr:MAG: structural protein [Eriocheir sinensis dicistrovirus 2]